MATGPTITNITAGIMILQIEMYNFCSYNVIVKQVDFSF